MMSVDGEAELFASIRAFEWNDEKNEAICAITRLISEMPDG
jgi:hypothetical protein